jgi:hypothetical protein
MRALGRAVLLGAVALAVAIQPAAQTSDAASHREAPLISLDPAADITDFFMFRSYETGKEDRVVLIMDVFPGGEPSSGPNYFTFDPNVRYTFHIDNDQDGRADDVRIDVRFQSEVRGTVDQFNLFLSYLGCGIRVAPCATPLPPVTALDGPGSEGLGLRQKYSLTIRRGDSVKTIDSDQSGKPLIAVPSNVGPSTMPSYAALAAQGVYDLSNDVRVFAGQRSDPFYIDLGAIFDTLNTRRNPPLLTPAEDANDAVNPFGIDTIGTFNVQTIAIEVPIKMLTRDGKSPNAGNHKLGAYASTSRRNVSVLRESREDDDEGSGRWIQVQRLANPLINETIIGTEDKDRWNALEPERESAFLDYYRNPRLALALQLVFGVPAATSNRDDLVDLLLRYQSGDRQLSELLRLDLDVLPRPLAAQRRMTVLAAPADPAGWPNGRRPRDDVTDIAVRVVGGPNYIAARAGDGVNTNFQPLPDAFPFLATPQNGRDRVHQNP